MEFLQILLYLEFLPGIHLENYYYYYYSDYFRNSGNTYRVLPVIIVQFLAELLKKSLGDLEATPGRQGRELSHKRGTKKQRMPEVYHLSLLVKIMTKSRFFFVTKQKLCLVGTSQAVNNDLLCSQMSNQIGGASES